MPRGNSSSNAGCNWTSRAEYFPSQATAVIGRLLFLCFSSATRPLPRRTTAVDRFPVVKIWPNRSQTLPDKLRSMIWRRSSRPEPFGLTLIPRPTKTSRNRMPIGNLGTEMKTSQLQETVEAEATNWFHSLEPVVPHDMVGLWKGDGHPSGHPLDGVLENLH